MKRISAIVWIGLTVVAFGSCKKEKIDPAVDNYGKITTAIVIVNPVINPGSSTTVVPGTKRSGVKIDAGNIHTETDATGLAVLQDIPVGSLPIEFNEGTVNLNVVAEKELYDVIVSVDNGVAEIVPAIRYPFDNNVVVLSPGDDIGAAATIDNAIILLEPGVYQGDYEFTGTGVVMIGAWSATEGPLSTIQGNLTVKGGNSRVRSVEVTEMLTCSANGFSAGFCIFTDANVTGNSITLLRNDFVGTSINVPSSNAVLVDNKGI